MDFASYVDEVVKDYKRMRILELADPKYIDDIYKIVKTNCSYFMKEDEIKVSFECINDILKQNDFLRYEPWTPTTITVSPNIIQALNMGESIGMKTCAILGFTGGKCKDMVQLPIHFEVNDMQISEDMQLSVGHICMQWLADQKIN